MAKPNTPRRDPQQPLSADELRERVWPQIERALADGRRRGLHLDAAPERTLRPALVAAAALLLAVATWLLLRSGADVEGAIAGQEAGAPLVAEGEASEPLEALADGGSAVEPVSPNSEGRRPLEAALTLGATLESVDFDVRFASTTAARHWPNGMVSFQALGADSRPLLGANGRALDLSEWLRPTADGWARNPHQGALPVGMHGLRVSVAGQVVDLGLEDLDETTLVVPSSARYEAMVGVEDSSGARVRDALVRLVPAADPTRFVTPASFTDDQGQARVATDYDDEHTLVVFAPGYRPLQIPGVRPDLAAGVPSLLTLERGTSLPGRLVDGDGVPLAGVHLAWRYGFGADLDLVPFVLAGAPRKASVRTDAQGRFRIDGIADLGDPEAEIQLEVLGRDLRGGGPPAGGGWMSVVDFQNLQEPAVGGLSLDPDRFPPLEHVDSVTTHLLGDDPQRSLEIELEAVVVEAMVIDAERNARSDAELAAERSGSSSTRKRLEPRNGGPVLRLLAAAGVPLDLRARHADGSKAALESTAAAATDGVPLELALGAAQGLVTVRVVHAGTGRPILGARYTVEVEGRALPIHGPLRSVNSSRGEYEVFVPPGDYTLQIFGPPQVADEVLEFGRSRHPVSIRGGETYALGEVTLPTGTALELWMPPIVSDLERPLDFPTNPPITPGRVEIELAYENGDFVAAQVVSSGDPAGMRPGSLQSEIWMPSEHNGEPNWFRFYLAERLAPGTWQVRFRLPHTDGDPETPRIEVTLPVVVTGSLPVQVVEAPFAGA